MALKTSNSAINEGISIPENVALTGVNLPTQITDALEKMKSGKS